jgi:hypothetical protein
MAGNMESYPAKLNIDYSDQSDRLTVFFRIILVIPIFIILILLTGGYMDEQTSEEGLRYAGTGGLVVLPTLLMILFRRKYPKWWFDWNLALTKFGGRVCSYILLLRDEYPSTDEEQAVHIELRYPDVQAELNRWLPLVKWFLAIPHIVVLCLIWVGAVVCVIIAWFAILFTGRYPRGLFDFVVGAMRWSLRVEAYAFLLTTDKYPPFSLSDLPIE